MNKSTAYPCPNCKNMIVKKSKCKRDFLRGTCDCIVLGHQILVIDQRGCYCSQSLLTLALYISWSPPINSIVVDWCSNISCAAAWNSSFIKFSYLSYCKWYLVFLVLGLCIEPITLLLTRMLLYDFSNFIF